MINGFVIDVENTSSEEFSIPLFKEKQLPEGISIRSIRGEYDYESSVLMAKNENFMGCGFQSDFIIKIQVISPEVIYDLDSRVVASDNKIILDGFNQYLSIVVPANSMGFFQLFPFIQE
jgi:hypothetical protein